MNEETLESLKKVIAYAHRQLNLKKRMTNDKFSMLIELSMLEKYLYLEELNIKLKKLGGDNK